MRTQACDSSQKKPYAVDIVGCAIRHEQISKRPSLPRRLAYLIPRRLCWQPEGQRSIGGRRDAAPGEGFLGTPSRQTDLQGKYVGINRGRKRSAETDRIVLRFGLDPVDR